MKSVQKCCVSAEARIFACPSRIFTHLTLGQESSNINHCSRFSLGQQIRPIHWLRPCYSTFNSRAFMKALSSCATLPHSATATRQGSPIYGTQHSRCWSASRTNPYLGMKATLLLQQQPRLDQTVAQCCAHRVRLAVMDAPRKHRLCII